MDQFIETMAKLAPFAIAGMVVPSWTKYVVILLGSGHPTRNSTMYVLGNASFRMLLGIVALWIYDVPIVEQGTTGPPGPEAAWLILPGLLLWALAVYMFRKPPSTDDTLPKWLQALEAVKPWMAFWTGFTMVALPGIQYVYFLSGVAVLATSSLTVPQTFLALMTFIAVLELMLLAPIVIFVRSGERGEAAMAKTKAWLTKHEYQVGAAVLFVFGGFMMLAGVMRL